MRGDTGTGAGGSEKPPEPPAPAGPGRTEPRAAERSAPVELGPGSERLTIAGESPGTGCLHGVSIQGVSVQGVSIQGVSPWRGGVCRTCLVQTCPTTQPGLSPLEPNESALPAAIPITEAPNSIYTNATARTTCICLFGAVTKTLQSVTEPGLRGGTRHIPQPPSCP